MARPPISMLPPVACSKPAIMLRTVVLPQPLVPRRQKNSPGSMSRSKWSTAVYGAPWSDRYTFFTFASRTSGTSRSPPAGATLQNGSHRLHGHCATSLPYRCPQREHANGDTRVGLDVPEGWRGPHWPMLLSTAIAKGTPLGRKPPDAHRLAPGDMHRALVQCACGKVGSSGALEDNLNAHLDIGPK